MVGTADLPQASPAPARLRRLLTQRTDFNFVPSPDRLLDESRRKLVVRGALSYPESIRMLEGRTSLNPLRRTTAMWSSTGIAADHRR